MRLIIAILFLSTFSYAQTNTRIDLSSRLQKCLDPLGSPIENCCVKTAANGTQEYVDCRELHDDALPNTAIGGSALNSVTTGFGNYAIGVEALSQVTTGNQNVAVGSGAIQFGNAQISTAIGYQAGRTGGSSDGVVNIGYLAGTAGGGPNAVNIGRQAGQAITSGQKNVTVGCFAGYEITTGELNVMIGNEAGGGLGNVSNKLAISNTTDATPLILGDFASSTLDINGMLTVDGNVQPLTDNTRYIGKNDDDAPKAYKGIILKDQTTGTYYRLEINSGAITIVDLTD
jgi:hypothetical protein